jgi:hypothetical protein
MKKTILATTILCLAIPLCNFGHNVVRKKSISQQLCHSKTNIMGECPNGTQIIIGIFTASYNCETMQIVNTDFYRTNNGCGGDSPLELPYP